MSYLIYKTNPLVISYVKVQYASRFGKPKRWWKAKGRLYTFLNKSMYDMHVFYKPTVLIYGADGVVLTGIECRSNQRADEVKQEILTKLETFLGSISNDRR
jgi:hypothetical protein